jgi:thioredoxin reductase (NADPH)
MDDVVIVGGGPAGASAATFTARAGLSTRVLDSDRGMTRRAMLWNHLGFPEGVSGPDLVERGQQQAINAGAAWEKAEVTGLERSGDTFVLRTADNRSIEASQVLLTVGANVDLAHAIGAETRPATEPRMKEAIVTDAEGRSTVPGIWAAGVAAGASVHTIITAGDGARVAINLISAVKGQRHVDHDALPPPAAPATATA